MGVHVEIMVHVALTALSFFSVSCCALTGTLLYITRYFQPHYFGTSLGFLGTLFTWFALPFSVSDQQCCKIVSQIMCILEAILAVSCGLYGLVGSHPKWEWNNLREKCAMENSARNCYWSKVQLGLQNASDATLLVVSICAIWCGVKLGATINCCKDNVVHVQNNSASLTIGESGEGLENQIQKLRADFERRSEYQKEL